MPVFILVFMVRQEVITPYAELDQLLVELLGHWRRILGDNLAGAYLQGSFALGAGDRHSDCDWLVATHSPLSEPQIAQLRNLHDEIPNRAEHWCHDLEGSYAPIAELASIVSVAKISGAHLPNYLSAVLRQHR